MVLQKTRARAVVESGPRPAARLCSGRPLLAGSVLRLPSALCCWSESWSDRCWPAARPPPSLLSCSAARLLSSISIWRNSFGKKKNKKLKWRSSLSSTISHQASWRIVVQLSRLRLCILYDFSDLGEDGWRQRVVNRTKSTIWGTGSSETDH